MKVKAFSFSASLREPYPRQVTVKTAVYAVSGGSIQRLECQTRSFSIELDALDFDAEFGDTIQLTVADVVRGLTSGEFECSVSECEGGNTLLKVYEVLLNGKNFKLLSAYKLSEGRLSKIYADTLTNLAPWRERLSSVSKLLDLSPQALEGV
jgi:hypothetical protein